ncbi:hypothetical protein C8N46_101635 [Kordia periserrulae]|uniref:Uncharacterized protein n=1 Tax=Kordia periserrulae TaxID=701523 RepID=A0A2T6C6W6_9FLAO|nr:class I lanthipeptide [Kordia periserrulae]PTX64025.1 hypothetical protein C8N46_101635 [Kordia periserrulae]
MKKKKTNLKKLTLNKKVVSKLEEGQVNGGTLITLACPVTLLCPRTLACPDTWLCPQTLDCPLTLDCSFNGCNSFIDDCPSALACPY